MQKKLEINIPILESQIYNLIGRCVKSSDWLVFSVKVGSRWKETENVAEICKRISIGEKVAMTPKTYNDSYLFYGHSDGKFLSLLSIRNGLYDAFVHGHHKDVLMTLASEHFDINVIMSHIIYQSPRRD
jgi:hypothetical protein